MENDSQYTELVYRFKSLTIWLEIKKMVEKYYNELSHENVIKFYNQTNNTIYNFCGENYGICYSEVPKLHSLIMDDISDIIENVGDKSKFSKDLKLGMKNGLRNWNRNCKTGDGISHLYKNLRDSLSV